MANDILKACSNNVALAANLRQLSAKDSKILAGQAITVATALASGTKDIRAHKILDVLTATGRPATGPVLAVFEDMVGD